MRSVVSRVIAPVHIILSLPCGEQKMQNSAHMKTKTLPLTPLMNLPPYRLALLLIPLVLACFALSPSTQAVVPAPDGGYPGGNTAEGQNALLSRTTGGFNAAIGWLSLRGLTTGS